MTRKVEVLEQAQFPSLNLSLIRMREIAKDGGEVYNIHLVDGRREYLKQLFNVGNKSKNRSASKRTDLLKSKFDEWKEVLEWIVEGENYLSFEQQSRMDR
tara:strand:+ start:24259 stop:24558 length:300 start_codon:yes stop_codon:yes gene_type:complete